MLRRIRPSKALVSCLRAMALAHARTGELDVSRRLLEEALAVASALHGQREIALTLGSIAEVEFATGRVDSAIATATEALAALGDAHDRSAWVQHVSGSVASYLLARNEVERALPLALARLRAARIMGMPHEVVRNLERLGLIAAKENRWALAARLCAHSEVYHSQRKVLRSFSSGFVYEQLQAELTYRLTPALLTNARTEAQWLGEEQLLAEVAAAWPGN